MAAASEDPDVIRVLLVDDQEVIREGVRSLISTSGHLAVVGECADGDEVVDRIRRLTVTDRIFVEERGKSLADFLETVG